jgi:cytochrome bd-type quinol oxidase subunit 1
MSPLGAILMRVMRAGCLAGAVFVAAVIAYEVWIKASTGQLSNLSRQDISFWVILALMLAGFLWLARSMGRELAKPRG